MVLLVAAALGVAGGLVAHTALSTEPARPAALPLPDLHGQATWAAGERRAPGFRLRDGLGGTRSLAAQHGHTTLITFLDSRCRSLCPLVGRAIGDTERSLPADARTTVLIVSVDPKGDTPKSVRDAARRWRLVPGWHWLTGTRQQLAAVWHAYGIVVRPVTNDIVHGAAVYLVDRRGYERAGYLAPLLPNFLSLDVRKVEAESAN
jgi:cytochrome oxidase Cu insertion factor (SCO1/SenC/PrrC family)